MTSAAYQAIPIDLDEYFGGSPSTTLNSSTPWLDSRRKRWIAGGSLVLLLIGLIVLIVGLSVHHSHMRNNKYSTFVHEDVNVSLTPKKVNSEAIHDLVAEGDKKEVGGKFHDLWLSESEDYLENNVDVSEDDHS
mmetsp:Transcript_10809/g.15930  ORF Transcript_10809/g.15930 Transcript_10809/m.15930 type:complete len:134 (+) Transcript_10809:140-541(+)|eukprot:CAMPEP_0194224526 /NCGR_PEP_ID=MMETSP0156-20130528/37725_1 /TAXON_ID=33649 /ORGANISM="Thalassionema nitzschioides, Strain L26-B" /LENGTH=133 /DNA_ID=CAMNT_0038956141 /DNA_START=92 /DNA_END=493 /DNA_ORIENTATION=+